jgi:hypothetical protein
MNLTEHDPLQLDPNRLDRELLVQPHLSRAAGQREAQARQDHAVAKAQLEVTAARLRLRIRTNPVGFGLKEKPTVDDVDSAVICQKVYQDALTNLNNSKYTLDVASADVTAYLDRRKAIEGLIELMALDYYAEREPKPHTPVSRETAEQMRRREIRRTE